MVMRNADDFIKRSKEAVDIIGRVGSRRLRDGDKVLTHCNSKAALGVIIQAHKDGKQLEVYATESRPWRQGLQTVKDLTAAGHQTDVDRRLGRQMADEGPGCRGGRGGHHLLQRRAHQQDRHLADRAGGP